MKKKFFIFSDYKKNKVNISSEDILNKKNIIYFNSINFKKNKYYKRKIKKKDSIIFIIKDENGTYHEKKLSETNPELIFIPKGIPAAHINIGPITGKILALADISWKPDNNEMKNVKFDDYEWEKWFNS